MGFEIENDVLKNYEEEPGITEITIPDSITSIGDDAFRSCSGLKSIVIPDSVTSIGDSSFSSCDNLTSIVIPDGVTSIGDSAFSGCHSLTSIVIPDSVTNIGSWAFSDCSSLTSIVIPDGVTSIGDGSFSSCYNLTSIVIPDSVTSISYYAFGYCYNLTSIIIPNSVTSIGENAFNGCSGLTSIVIPDGVTNIGKKAFNGCGSLTSIVIPGSVTSIGGGAFYGTLWLKSLGDLAIVNGILLCYSGKQSELVIPDSITSIGDSAFAWCENLTSIVIPDSVTKIGDRVFNNCKSLTSIVIPDSVTSIGKSAFDSCENLTNIVIPDSVTSIGDGSFSSCKNLTSIVIPDSVTSISNYAFEYCYNLTSIIIPDSVTSIGDKAFGKCSCLTRIAIPDSVTSIGRSAFELCENLTSIVIPDSVTSIGDSAFEWCKNLRSVVIPNSVTSIEKNAFEWCENLRSIVIPDSVTSIGDSAFYNCHSLTSIVIPDSVTSIGKSAFWGCESLTSIVIPESVTDIGEQAFAGCPDLREFMIPQNGLRLGKEAFGSAFPVGLALYCEQLYPYMTDGMIKQYFLEKRVWEKIPTEQQSKLFIERHGKTLLPSYKGCVTNEQAEVIGRNILMALTATNSVSLCNTAACLMTTLPKKLPSALLRQLHAALQHQKAGAKAVKSLEDCPLLIEKLGASEKSDKKLPPEEKLVREYLLREKCSVQELEATLKSYYSLSFKDLPVVCKNDSAACAPYVVAWLLTAHERTQKTSSSQFEVVAAYKKPGMRPEAEALAAQLKGKSFRAAMAAIAKANLGMSGRSKKMFLAYPICRYADEELMMKLAREAQSWRSSVSGDDAPPLLTFRNAAIYSNTRAAMLIAERYHELDRYAAVRGMNEDTIRDKYLSDVGLDAKGEKAYDLGNQIVTAVLQDDLSFLVTAPGAQKPAKSLPKKGAEEQKFEAASKDFAEMKKNAKKIMKNRIDRLFEDFLSGRTRTANLWSDAYLNNPLLRKAASLVVWSQGKKTFTVTASGLVTADEAPYELGKRPVAVAHPMSMTQADVAAWQKYFIARSLKQPFAQIWEPVVDPGSVKEDRYKGSMIPYYRFVNQKKHGIFVEDYDFHNEIDITFKECEAAVDRIDWQRHAIEMTDRFEVKKVSFKKYTRRVNHIVTYLDRITVHERVLKDDVSIAAQLPEFTLAQISEFIDLAAKNNCPNCTALLLAYKNDHFAEFDPMDEFVLE